SFIPWSPHMTSNVDERCSSVSMALYSCLTMSSISRCFGTMLGLRDRIGIRINQHEGYRRGHSPSRSGFAAEVVKAEVMKNHGVPIAILQLPSDIPCDVVINLGKVLPVV